jgi:hypothetical protein
MDNNIYDYVLSNFNVVEFNSGHIKKVGRDCGIYKNPFWKIIENDKEKILMFCKPNDIIKLCPLSYQKILNYEEQNNIKITWFKSSNGYIVGNNKLYMHQIILNCYGNGRGTKIISVDHIDRNPLNNCFDNLRIATRDIQEQNSKGIISGTKRERKISAKQLPQGITQDMLKKYVVFYEDYADKEKKRQRQYFKVESHPKLKKPWIGCKSKTKSIFEKLSEANSFAESLDLLV